ncbi:hypothetical protein PUN28_017123 [Cardiocondyla obscurior]|uniref:Uncharacterized protein n=1 Tax=Cardiocondyla obscurior TaxID=286306 RepID=A0AAW2EMJ5_9HYME
MEARERRGRSLTEGGLSKHLHAASPRTLFGNAVFLCENCAGRHCLTYYTTLTCIYKCKIRRWCVTRIVRRCGCSRLRMCVYTLKSKKVRFRSAINCSKLQEITNKKVTIEFN